MVTSFQLSAEPSTNIYSHFIKPICLPTECHVTAQSRRFSKESGGVHKLIVTKNILYVFSYLFYSDMLCLHFTPEFKPVDSAGPLSPTPG